MVSRAVILILTSVLIAGCGVRRMPVVSAADADRANLEIGDRSVLLTMTDGTRLRCERVFVALDTCTCVRRQDSDLKRIDTRLLASASRVRPWRGALRGLLIGAGVGELAGLVSLAGASGNPFAGIALIAGPVVGGLVGMVVGPIGTTDVYEFAGAGVDTVAAPPN